MMRWILAMGMAIAGFAAGIWAQDGISPDSVRPIFIGKAWAKIDTAYYTNSDSTCAWKGIYESAPCGSLYKGMVDTDGVLNVAIERTVMEGYFTCHRASLGFDLMGLIPSDSVKLRIYNQSSTTTDGDCLWVVQWIPRCKATCKVSAACLLDSCNYYACGGLTFPLHTTDKFAVLGEPGWLEILLDPSVENLTDTTLIGFVMRREPGGAPTGRNHFETPHIQESDACYLIRWFSEKTDARKGQVIRVQ